MKRNTTKTIVKTIVTIVVLLLVFVGGGVGYVYYTGKQPPKKPAAQTQVTTTQALPKPHEPDPRAAEGAAIEELLSPVAAGANTTIYVRTQPTSTCTIDVKYNGVPSKDSGLAAKTADGYGSVSWTWTVDRTAAIGTWPVGVTCAFHGKTGFVQGDLQVTK